MESDYGHQEFLLTLTSIATYLMSLNVKTFIIMIERLQTRITLSIVVTFAKAAGGN